MKLPKLLLLSFILSVTGCTIFEDTLCQIGGWERDELEECRAGIEYKYVPPEDEKTGTSS